MDVAGFAARGYSVERGVIPLNVIEDVLWFVRSHAERASTEVSALIGRRDGEPLIAAIRRAEAEGRIESLPKEVRDILSGHLPLSARLSQDLWKIPAAELLREVLRQAVGSEEIYMHMPPMARFVPPDHMSAAVPPHQDIAYNRHMTDFITCWIPLVEIDEACGGVGVYEGTNREVELAPGEGDVFWIGPVQVDEKNLKPLCMKPGDVLVFNKWLVHKSMPNRSERTRYSLDLRFFGRQSTSSKHYLDLQTWSVVAPAADEVMSG